MKEEPLSLLRAWSIHNVVCYLLLGLIGSLLIRVLSCLLTATELRIREAHPFFREFWTTFRGGFTTNPRKDDDCWFPFVIGLLEFLSFPVLMVTEHWTFIGAWMGFKGLGQFKRWAEERSVFNRFLICNACVLLWSYFVLRHFVDP